MATPKKLPSGNWNVMVFSHIENGKRKYVSFTAPTKAEANRLAAEFQANKQNQSQPQNVTVGEAIEKYISIKTNVLSPRTLREYKRYVKQYEPIKNIRIGSLETRDLQNYANELSRTKSSKTVRNLFGLLMSSIQLYTDRNFKITFPPKAVIERHIPTDTDVNMLIENANPRLKLAIILGSQGMRRGEIASLKFKDILRDFNAVYIHSDMILDDNNEWVYKETPKTSKSVRRLDLPKEIIEMLGTGDDEDYVLGILPSTITSDFINLRNKFGLKCRFHDLRHYSASILHALGLPDAYIMERNGWSSDRTMKEIYRHMLSDKANEYSSIANEYYMKNIMKNQSDVKQIP